MSQGVQVLYCYTTDLHSHTGLIGGICLSCNLPCSLCPGGTCPCDMCPKGSKGKGDVIIMGALYPVPILIEFQLLTF